MKARDKMRDRRRKNSKKDKLSGKFWLGVFIVATMVLSGFGVILYGFNSNDDDNTLDYNGTSFHYVQSRGTFVANIVGKDVEFLNHPNEVDDINITPELDQRIKNSLELDFTYDPDNPLKQDIAFSIFYVKQAVESTSNTYVRIGFTKDNEYNLTKITCADATPYVPVFVFEYSNSTGITEVGNCVLLRGDRGSEMQRYASRILYSFYGVI